MCTCTGEAADGEEEPAGPSGSSKTDSVAVLLTQALRRWVTPFGSHVCVACMHCVLSLLYYCLRPNVHCAILLCCTTVWYGTVSTCCSSYCLCACSNDRVLLERCLATSNSRVIHNTVARIVPRDAALFLRAAVDR